MRKGIAKRMLGLLVLAVVVIFMGSTTAIGLLGKGQIEFIMENVARNELRESTSYSKLLSSPRCLSTGKVGVMDQYLLDLKNGTPRLDCVYHPGLWTYVEINDTDNNRKYVFGSPGVKQIIEREHELDSGKDVEEGAKDYSKEEFKVGIKDGDDIRLGIMDIYYLRPPTTLVSISRAAHIAWEEDSTINNFPIRGPRDDFILNFTENGICEDIGIGDSVFGGSAEVVCRDIPMSWVIKEIRAGSPDERGEQEFTLHVEKERMDCGGVERDFLNFTVTKINPP